MKSDFLRFDFLPERVSLECMANDFVMNIRGFLISFQDDIRLFNSIFTALRFRHALMLVLLAKNNYTIDLSMVFHNTF